LLYPAAAYPLWTRSGHVMARSQPAAPRYMKMKPDEDHQERRRDQAAERTLRSLMTASANAQARIGALAEMYSREGRERRPEESAEMLALMRAQRERARQMNALADQYSWDVDMVSRLLAEPPRP
jgi:hypothetical protein